MAPASDAQLVAASRAGPPGAAAAFAALVERHRARVGAVVLSVLGDPADAEDVVQEALLCAYRDLPRLREPDRFGAWLTRIAVNLARMRLRRRRVLAPLDAAAEAVSGAEAAETDAEAALEAAEAARRVGPALAALPEPQRRLLELRYRDDLTPGEIGARLGLSSGAVRVRLHRARRTIRAALAPDPRPPREESPMVEIQLHDVLVRLTDAEAADPPSLGDRLRVVLLHDPAGDRLLPIWIAPAEGDVLAWHRGGQELPRPVSADLMASLLAAVGGHVEQVAITDLREDTFYAAVRVRSAAGAQEVDARPSDALNLATRVGAPVFADPGLLERAAIPPDGVSERLDQLERERLGAPARPGAWRSLSPDLLRRSYLGPRTA